MGRGHEAQFCAKDGSKIVEKNACEEQITIDSSPACLKKKGTSPEPMFSISVPKANMMVPWKKPRYADLAEYWSETESCWTCEFSTHIAIVPLRICPTDPRIQQ